MFRNANPFWQMVTRVSWHTDQAGSWQSVSAALRAFCCLNRLFNGKKWIRIFPRPVCSSVCSSVHLWVPKDFYVPKNRPLGRLRNKLVSASAVTFGIHPSSGMSNRQTLVVPPLFLSHTSWLRPRGGKKRHKNTSRRKASSALSDYLHARLQHNIIEFSLD